MRTPVTVTLLLCLGCRGSSATAAADDGGAPSAVARVASCDRASVTGTCSEYEGSYLAQNENLLKASCAKLGGTYVLAECPNTSVIGSCKLSTGESRKFYGTGASAYEPDRARKECEATFRGAWQPR